jgi:hypothetical protein
VWQTALYPASQAAALALAIAPWPEVWGCRYAAAGGGTSHSTSSDTEGAVPPKVAACSMNGHCGASGACVCGGEPNGCLP